MSYNLPFTKCLHPVKEHEKTNVSLTLNNATEEKREEKITKEIRKEENIREEEDSGFREYKL